jgi:hypothetical protein
VQFSRGARGVVTAEVSELEAAVLTSVLGQLLQLLGQQDAAHDDPLAAMVGIPSGEVSRPADPALARLLPDAYRHDASDDPSFDVEEATAEFRRYTEPDLRATKRAHATTVLDTLGRLPAGGRLELVRAEADAWLGALNDLRLVLGTRLQVTDDPDDQPVPADEDTAHAMHVYGWLGWLQESLIDCLDPSAGG